jgi:hypothetical protein
VKDGSAGQGAAGRALSRWVRHSRGVSFR